MKIDKVITQYYRAPTDHEDSLLKRHPPEGVAANNGTSPGLPRIV